MRTSLKSLLLFTPQGGETAPTGLTANWVSLTQIDLAWVDNASDETEYRIYRSDDGAAFALIDTIAADSESYSDTTADSTVEYTYKVAAANLLTEEFSAEATAVVPYLLLDTFDDTLAAGAINDTLATDGTHTRKVIDTANALTMGSGKLVAVGGSFSYNDPGIYYLPYLDLDAVSCAVGFTWRGAATIVASLGLSTRTASGNAVTGQPDYGRIGLSTAVNLIFSLGNGKPTAYFPVVAASNTDYQTVFVTRAGQGVTVLMKGGVFTDWAVVATFPPIAIVDASPAYTGHSGASISIMDIRATELIPSTAPIAADSFNRANGVLGSTDGTVNGEVGGSGLAWTAALGTWGISSNKAQASALDGTTSNAIAIIDPEIENVVYSAYITRTGDEAGLVLKYVDSDNYIRFQINGATFKLIKRVGGSETEVLTQNNSGSGWCQIVQYGTSYTIALASAGKKTAGTIDDAVFDSVTTLGLYTTNTGNTFDWVMAKAIGGGGEYAGFTLPFPSDGVISTLTLPSSLDSAVTLNAQIYYPSSGGQDLPILAVLAGYDGTPNSFSEAAKQAFADYGVVAVFPRLRGRGAPATGDKDDSGYEVQDIIDIVDRVRAALPDVASQTDAYIVGYSGGGGICLNALCKFPDYWIGGVDHFGMSSYAAWWSENTTYRTPMNTRIGGDAVNGTPANEPDKYKARSARDAITNFSGGHLWIVHDPADTIVLPAQSVAVTDALDGASLTNYSYHDEQAWGHTYPIPAAEPLWIPDVQAGTYSAWTVPASGTLKVAGYIVTKRFSLWLGDGLSEFGEVVYDMATRTFTITTETDAADWTLTLKGQTPSASVTATINGVEDTETSDSAGNVIFTGSIA